MTTSSKNKVIAEIFELTKGDPKHFDKLDDKSTKYLDKFLKVIKRLK